MAYLPVMYTFLKVILHHVCHYYDETKHDGDFKAQGSNQKSIWFSFLTHIFLAFSKVKQWSSMTPCFDQCFFLSVAKYSFQWRNYFFFKCMNKLWKKITCYFRSKLTILCKSQKTSNSGLVRFQDGEGNVSGVSDRVLEGEVESRFHMGLGISSVFDWAKGLWKAIKRPFQLIHFTSENSDTNSDSGSVVEYGSDDRNCFSFGLFSWLKTENKASKDQVKVGVPSFDDQLEAISRMMKSTPWLPGGVTLRQLQEQGGEWETFWSTYRFMSNPDIPEDLKYPHLAEIRHYGHGIINEFGEDAKFRLNFENEWSNFFWLGNDKRMPQNFWDSYEDFKDYVRVTRRDFGLPDDDLGFVPRSSDFSLAV